ncbi:MAG TPA: Ig-like domain-containing protein, partial [Gemmatimonadales bacterium]|nr:Ig-like domain-containing protein [Gemmatimonadales bacterium]
MRTLSHILVLVGLTAWLGCIETMEPVPGPAVRVLVHPAGMSIPGVGQTAAFSSVAVNAHGDTITSPAVTWSSLDPHVATIDARGTATAVGSGQVTVAAQVDGQTGYALLTVSAAVDSVTSWNAEIPPAFPLASVWGTSATDVYAVGAGGTILHYDGHSWSAMTSGTGASFSGVWGTSAGDIYAVGVLSDLAQANGAI